MLILIVIKVFDKICLFLLEEVLLLGRLFVQKHLDLAFEVLESLALVILIVFIFLFFKIHRSDLVIEIRDLAFEVVNIDLALAALIHAVILLRFSLVKGLLFHGQIVEERGVFFVFAVIRHVDGVRLVEFLCRFRSHRFLEL